MLKVVLATWNDRQYNYVIELHDLAVLIYVQQLCTRSSGCAIVPCGLIETTVWRQEIHTGIIHTG